jgi:multiple sugar transport system substrate-binding protein
MVHAGLYRPVDELAKKERGLLESFYPSAIDAFRSGGKLYGLWHYANPQVVFYNKDLLARSGVREPAADWTHQQMLDLSRAVTQRTGDPGTAVWGTDTPGNYLYVFNYIRAFGGALFDNDDAPTRFTPNNAGALQALQFIADLLLTHRVAPTAQDLAGQGNLFHAGRQAFWTAIAVVIGQTRRQLAQDWDIAPVPRGPAGRSSYYGGAGIALTASERRDSAPVWTFLNWAAGLPGQRELMPELGAVPTLKALEAEYLRQPSPPTHLKVAVETMAFMQSLPKLPDLSLWLDAIEPAFKAIFSGEKNAAAALAEIESRVNQGLRV